METGRDDGRAERMGWAGAQLPAAQGSDSPLQGGPFARLLCLGEPSTLGGKQVVGGKVGQWGACSGRGKESGVVPVQLEGRGRGLPGKDPEGWQRERLDILALNVSISTHQRSKLKPRVRRTLPKMKRGKNSELSPPS